MSEDEDPPESRHGGLIALAFLVALALLGLWISGRWYNCGPGQ